MPSRYGFKLEKECLASGQRSNCTPCPERQFTSEMNNFPNCFSCKICKAKNNEVEVSPCEKHKNTICRCKDGYYKSHIDSGTYQCLRCAKCKSDETEKQTCTPERNTVCECKENYYRVKGKCEPCKNCSAECKDHCTPLTTKGPDPEKDLIDVIVGVITGAAVLLVLVIVITYKTTKQSTKKKLLKLSSQSSDQSPDSCEEVLVNNKEISNIISVKAAPPSPVSEQETANLPDCVPLEIKIPDLIYTVLDQVPVPQVKQLVRSLGVRDIEIEHAELDHRSCQEAHYQMLRVWAERGSHAGRGGILHWPLLQDLLDKLREMHLGWAAEELETNVSSNVNSAGGNDSLMEEVLVPWRDGVDAERQRDTETRETDVDGTTAAADTNIHHRGSADKHKFSTLGYQASETGQKCLLYCHYRWWNRRTKQKVVTDFATLSKGASAGAKPRAALRQVLFSQGVSEKNPASEVLCCFPLITLHADILRNRYRLAPDERGQLDLLKQGLGTYAVPANLKWRWKEESQGTMLEKSWTDIVHSHSLVIAALVDLRQHGFLVEVTPELLFSNLPSILKAHQVFWQEVIYPMLQEVRRTGRPFDPMRLEAGCLQFHERFSSYKHYCWEEENNLEFTRRQMESNQHFLTYVQWVETHPQCERMRLGDMQAKPHQRITKYPLLLKAVLKSTGDPHVQHTLRGMLSSVNNFLESINDYLKLKDEELALTISAQRVEGYEVEGINEEIDKYVREICQFDLTCPISGVGPEVVRKLLLEENLKIRGRKDSKLEVVALLFSDVLLMTKVQKKGERLRVVRPPLALDRTYCIALKDGCSFVLVEVGELRSVMNVYIFVASTSESCSTWVSTIHQAKETLSSLRQTESNRRQANWKMQQLEAKHVTEAKMDDMETEEQPLTQSRRETFVDELTEELIMPQSVNGILASKKAEPHQPPDDAATNNTVVPFWHSQSNKNNHKLVHKGFPGRQQAAKGHEWIEMGVRREQVRIHTEDEEESLTTKEQRVSWNHRVQSVPNLDHFTHSMGADPLKYNTTGPHYLLLDGYPDVDYPLNEDDTPQPPYQPTGTVFIRLPGAEGTSTRRASDLVNQDTRRNSSNGQSRDMETPKVWGFTQNLKSPGLQRRRPVSTHQFPSTQTSRQFSQGPGQAWSASNNDACSNSDSEYKLNIKRNSVPSSQNSKSHRVLKLGSLKPNQGMFWNMHDRVSPDPQTLSESELPDPNFKRPKMKTQRSASIPNIIIEGRHGLCVHSSSLYTSPQKDDTQSPIPGHNPSGHPSPLEGLLERAKERGGLKRDRNVKMSNLRGRYPPSPSFSTTPSPSPSDGDRDTEWEEEVEVIRHRALTVSQGWKEQLVDGDEDEKRDSVIFPDGVNVDWSGWCFDDDEVMDYLRPGAEGLLEGISRSLNFWDLHGLSEQDDGEYSQV
ncbi:hypothetical protein L3Q82_013339 [Scortum barcoo]|uniref:Uncharacterized protein n=1 Tax=Scortum barcoo TaxID=214431 RepID=A0ACB8VZV5_9TELE|nr:hypothetical protein L3Q82_013339 [Scortum barcoo]